MPWPAGTIVFLFTDIEGSTRLWEAHPAAMGAALRRHDMILRTAAAAHDGHVFKTIGDAFCIAFHDAHSAIAAASQAQQQLAAERWGDTGPLRVRMALHAGTAEARDNDYFGNSLNRVARILAAAHGGQVLLSLPARELLGDELPGHLELRDLGERRLRDLTRPEHLFQLVVDGLPAEFPPLRTLENTPNNLPVAVSTFIGRERERHAVKRLLVVGRLVTLLGTGGTGKTRLALQTAEELLDGFPDGVWLVELANLSDPDRLAETVAAAAGLREEPGESPRQALARFFGDRRVLLILDNCEHLIAACAELAAELLRHSAALRILATSRQSLGIAGEQSWTVPPLDVPRPGGAEVRAGPPAVAPFAAIRLFVERAGAVRQGFQLSPANLEPVVQICWRLDGIPLAIELAAARMRVLSPHQIAQRLDDRFRLLTGGGRSVLPHQQTLRTLIDWSHDLLTEPERILFRRLAVFAGGRTLDAVESVCTGNGIDPDATLDLLQSLADKSLLVVETDAADAARYTMIESVWQYARERLAASDEEPALRDRHLAWFLTITEEAGPGLLGADAAPWLDRIDADRANFRLAIEWAAESPERTEFGLRMAAALVRYLEIRGNFEEGRDLFTALLDAPGADSPTPARAEALAGAARMAWGREDLEQAARRYRESVELYRSLGQTRDAIREDAMLAFIECESGYRLTVEARFQKAVDAGHEFHDVMLTAVGLSGLGRCALLRGEVSRSRRLREESLAIYRASGDEWICCYLLWGIARACLADSDVPAARAALEEWTSIIRKLGNRWALPYVLGLFAEVRLREGDAPQAARLLGAAEAGRDQLGVVIGEEDRADWEAAIAGLAKYLTPAAQAAEWAIGSSSDLWESIDAAVRAGTEQALAA